MNKITLTLFLLSAILCSCTNIENKEQTTDSKSFEIIGTKHNNVVQNFYLFVTDTSKEKLNEIYTNFKKENCTMECNINIYNTKEGFNLEQNYQKEKGNLIMKLTNQEINKQKYLKLLDQFDSKSYCELANALVATGDFSSNEIYFYPYKDWRYKELKCK